MSLLHKCIAIQEVQKAEIANELKEQYVSKMESLAEKFDIRNLSADQIKGKVGFHRIDGNVKGAAARPLKLVKSVETAKLVIENGGSLVVTSHFGRPNGLPNESFSTEGIAAKYKQLLIDDGVMTAEEADKKFVWINDTGGPEVKEQLDRMGPGSIVFLQNVQFELGEIAEVMVEKCFKKAEDVEKFREQFGIIMDKAGFNLEEKKAGLKMALNEDQKDAIRAVASQIQLEHAERLVEHADFVVQDGFGQTHRKYGSIADVQKLKPAAMGILLSNEIKNFRAAQNPTVIIMGGAKEDKMRQLQESNVKNIFVAGGIAHALIKVIDKDSVFNNIGIDDASLNVASEIIDDAVEIKNLDDSDKNIEIVRSNGGVITIPKQVMVIEGSEGKGFGDYFDENTSLKDGANLIAVDIRKIGIRMSVDTSIESVNQFFDTLDMSSARAGWNGPVGVADDLEKAAAKGSLEVRKRLEDIVDAGGKANVGGGETGVITQDSDKIATSTGGGVVTSMIQMKPNFGIQAFADSKPVESLIDL